MVRIFYFQRRERLKGNDGPDPKPEEFFYMHLAETLINRRDGFPLDKYHQLEGDGRKLMEARAIAERVNPGFEDKERVVSFFDITEIRMDEKLVYELIDRLRRRDNLERDIRKGIDALSAKVDEQIYKFKR